MRRFKFGIVIGGARTSVIVFVDVRSYGPHCRACIAINTTIGKVCQESHWMVLTGVQYPIDVVANWRKTQRQPER